MCYAFVPNEDGILGVIKPRLGMRVGRFYYDCLTSHKRLKKEVYEVGKLIGVEENFFEFRL